MNISTSCISSPPLVPVPLLCSSDEYCISSTGISRTLYKLIDYYEDNNDEKENKEGNIYSVEEEYDLQYARKIFTVRSHKTIKEDSLCDAFTETAEMIERQQHKDKNNKQRQDDVHDIIHLGPEIAQEKIFIQEISHRIEQFGTGAQTWESSIASSLYFSSGLGQKDKNCHYFKGRVLELGSGVGLAALLTTTMLCLSSSSNNNSKGNNSTLSNHRDPENNGQGTNGQANTTHLPCDFTLSDYSSAVIDQCRQNILLNNQNANQSRNHRHCLALDPHVYHIDWYDTIHTKGGDSEIKTRKSMAPTLFNTIVGSDIVNKRQDIVPLLLTISKYLKPERESTAHIFGPSNRAALLEFVQVANHWALQLNLKVQTEMVEMERFRLVVDEQLSINQQQYPTFVQMQMDDEKRHASKWRYASRHTCRFLHIILRVDNGEVKEACGGTTTDIHDLD